MTYPRRSGSTGPTSPPAGCSWEPGRISARTSPGPRGSSSRGSRRASRRPPRTGVRQRSGRSRVSAPGRWCSQPERFLHARERRKGWTFQSVIDLPVSSVGANWSQFCLECSLTQLSSIKVTVGTKNQVNGCFCNNFRCCSHF